MPRQIRVYYPGAIYHVMMRGNAGEIIFFDDHDRIYFYKLIHEGIQRYKYSWSSHRAYLGFESISWLTTDWLLSFFSKDSAEAINYYRKFMLENVNESLQKSFNQGNQKGYAILGNDDFLNKLSLKRVMPNSPYSLHELVTVITNHYGIDITELQYHSQKHRNSRIRAIIAYLAREFKIATLTSVARYFRRDVSGLIHAMRLLEDKPNFREEVISLLKWLKD